MQRRIKGCFVRTQKEVSMKNKKTRKKVWLFHIYLLNLPSRTCLMWFFGVADGRCSLRVADILRKRVRFISCLRNRTLLIVRKGTYAWHWPCVMGKRRHSLPFDWIYTSIVYISRRCELISILHYTGQSSTFKQRIGKPFRLTPFFLCLILITIY